MCGTPIEKAKARTVYIEGALLWVCSNCYSRIVKKSSANVAQNIQYLKRSQRTITLSSRRKGFVTSQISRTSATRRRSLTILEKFELVEDYAERIRKAREQRGWSQAILAEKVKESETTIKRIESGRLRPTIELAKRLEEVLGIRLLVPSIDEELESENSVHKYVTLGEIVTIKKKEE